MKPVSATRWIGMVLLVSGLAGCAADKDPESIKIGERAPSFSLKTADGTTLTSQSLEGQIVVLIFWSTTCRSCVQELPELQQLATSSKAKIIGVALDEDGWRVVKPVLDRHGITYPIALGNEELFTRFGGYAIPHTVVLDRSLRIAKVYRGAVTGATLAKDIHALEGKL